MSGDLASSVPVRCVCGCARLLPTPVELARLERNLWFDYRLEGPSVGRVCARIERIAESLDSSVAELRHFAAHRQLRTLGPFGQRLEYFVTAFYGHPASC